MFSAKNQLGKHGIFSSGRYQKLTFLNLKQRTLTIVHYSIDL